MKVKAVLQTSSIFQTFLNAYKNTLLLYMAFIPHYVTLLHLTFLPLEELEEQIFKSKIQVSLSCYLGINIYDSIYYE